MNMWPWRAVSENNRKLQSSEIYKAETELWVVPELGPLWSTMTEMLRIAREWPNLHVTFRRFQPFLQPSMERYSKITADFGPYGTTIFGKKRLKDGST
jgi:hypothetical protein